MPRRAPKACAVAIGLCTAPLAAQTTRSAQLLPPLETIETSGFDRSQSAALFTHDEKLAEVRTPWTMPLIWRPSLRSTAM